MFIASDEICVFAFDILLIYCDYGSSHNLLVILKFVYLHSTHCLSVQYQSSKYVSRCDETSVQGLDIQVHSLEYNSYASQAQRKVKPGEYYKCDTLQTGQVLSSFHFRRKASPSTKKRQKSQRRNLELFVEKDVSSFAEIVTSTPFSDLFLATNLR